MMAGRTSARSLVTALLTLATLTLALLAIGPTALAMAAPNLTIEKPLAGSVTNKDMPLFGGSSDDEVEVVKVNVYEGPSAEGLPVATLATTLAPSEGKWEVATETPLAPGVYTAVAEQELEGAVSAPVTFTIDTVAPAVSLEPVSSPTSNAEPTLSGGAGTEAGDSSTVDVTIYKGESIGGEVASSGAATNEGATWSYKPSQLPDGTYTAQATQQDEAGNTGASTAVTFTVDTTAPAVSLEPVPSPKNNAAPTLTGAVGTAAGDSATVDVTIYKGASVGGEVASSGEAVDEGATWSFTPTHLADGTYTARATQKDEAGNTGKSAAVTFTVDTEPPKLTIVKPADEAVLKTSKTTFSGLAGQASGDDPSVTVNIYKGPTASGSPSQTLEVTAVGGKWTTGAPGLALKSGIYTVQAEQADAAGNIAAPTVTFTVATDSPVVTLDASAFTQREGVPFTDATPSFSGTASTAPEDSEVVHVKIYKGKSTSGSPVSTVVGAMSGSQWKAGPAAALPGGTYTALAEQEDSDPFSETGVSDPVTFTVDAQAPAVTLSAPATGSSTSSSSEPLAGAAGTAAGDSATITVQLYAGTSTEGQSPLEAVSVQASAGAWSAAFGGLSPGTYSARAEQRDDVGNVGLSAPTTFTVTAPVTPPPVTVPTPAPPPVPAPAPPSAPTLMQPFPVVRIAGSESSSGARISLLSVQAPVGSTVTVICHGRGCPARAKVTVPTSGRGKRAGVVLIVFRRFQRSLRAGSTLQIEVSGPGQIGKYTRFTIRRGKLPSRLDTCLSPTGFRPLACPS